MRRNQNLILRCGVTEGKSGGQHRDHQESPTGRKEGDTRKEAAERLCGHPALWEFTNETTLCRRAFQRCQQRPARGIARPDTP